MSSHTILNNFLLICFNERQLNSLKYFKSGKSKVNEHKMSNEIHFFDDVKKVGSYNYNYLISYINIL